MTNQSILLEKVTNVLLGTYDFQELAKKAVSLIVKELGEINVIGAAIFRLDDTNKLVRAFAYSTRYRRTIDKLLPKNFSDLNLDLSNNENLVVATITNGQIQQSPHLSDFSKGVLPDTLTNKIQHLMKVRLIVSLPIKLKSGRTAGAILFVLREEKLTGQEIVLLQTLSNQLGLAFSNVFAFEKLLKAYKKSSNKSGDDPENIPNLKFTLRITAKENKRLENIAKERNKTKAEVIRELIDKMI